MFQTTSQICICIIHLFLLPGLPNNGTPTIIPSTSQWSQRWSLRTVGHAASAKKEAFHRVVSRVSHMLFCTGPLEETALRWRCYFPPWKLKGVGISKSETFVPISHKLIGTDWITQRWPARRECKGEWRVFLVTPWPSPIESWNSWKNNWFFFGPQHMYVYIYIYMYMCVNQFYILIYQVPKFPGNVPLEPILPTYSELSKNHPAPPQQRKACWGHRRREPVQICAKGVPNDDDPWNLWFYIKTG